MSTTNSKVPTVWILCALRADGLPTAIVGTERQSEEAAKAMGRLVGCRTVRRRLASPTSETDRNLVEEMLGRTLAPRSRRIAEGWLAEARS